MASATGVWRPDACVCGKVFTSKSVAIWNGKPGRESAMICVECYLGGGEKMGKRRISMRLGKKAKRLLKGGPFDGHELRLSGDASTTLTFGCKGFYGRYVSNEWGLDMNWAEVLK